jgi:cytochrome c-type biogenesis protein
MSIDSMLTSFTLGLLATTSPCVLPLYPGFLAYLAGGQERFAGSSNRFLGLFVLAGVLTTMVALGGFIALLAIPVGKALAVAIPISDVLILVLGLLLIANINPFKGLPQIQAPIFRHPFGSAFVYGMLYGPIALPCSGPLVVGIFAFSLTAEQALGKLAVFVWFGLGFGLPLLLLSLMSGSAQRGITRQLAIHSRIINFIAGLLMIGVAVYDIRQNWGLILAYI